MQPLQHVRNKINKKVDIGDKIMAINYYIMKIKDIESIIIMHLGVRCKEAT